MTAHVRPRCFLDIQSGTEPLGRIVIELFDDKTPKTCENFRALCTGAKGPPLHYKSSIFHRVIEEFMIQGGDITRGDGKGGLSIYGETFEDEALHWRNLDAPYLVAMANRGPATNSSQFFITLEDCSHLNGKHTVFGHIVSGSPVVKKIESMRTNSDDKPLTDIIIANCGELEFKRAPVSNSAKEIVGRESKRSRRHRSRSTSSDRSERKNGSSRDHRRSPKRSEPPKESPRSNSRSPTPPARERERSISRQKDNLSNRGRSLTPKALSSQGGSHKSRHRSQSPSRSHSPPARRRSRSPRRRRSRSQEHRRHRQGHHQKERRYDRDEEEMIKRQEQEREGRRFYDNDTNISDSGAGGDNGDGGIVFKGRGVMKFREKKRWGGGGNRYGRLD